MSRIVTNVLHARTESVRGAINRHAVHNVRAFLGGHDAALNAFAFNFSIINSEGTPFTRTVLRFAKAHSRPAP